ncbi:MAG: CHRD domain-containing protein [Alphaproteobacteria bacterium]|nr:CHRD domain-containing protein [Alphaproteobacteria bacterium]
MLFLAALALTLSATAHAADAPASNDPIVLCVSLSDADQSHPVTSDGVGRGVFKLRRGDLTLDWEIAFKNLSGPIVEANIHGPQRPGANAQALFPLAEKAGAASPLKGSIVLTDGQLKYLLNSRMYANVTTARHPAGEIRGQLQRVRPGVICPTF